MTDRSREPLARSIRSTSGNAVSRRARILGSLVLFAAASAGAETLTSAPYGAVDFGDRVAYRVDGPNCASASVQIRIEAGPSANVVLGAVSNPLPDGIDPSGCVGAAQVPGFNDVRAAGWEPGDPIAIEMVSSGLDAVALRHARIEVDRGAPAAGSPMVVAANDQDTGSGDSAMRMSGGDSVNLGRVNLNRVDSFSLRLCADGHDLPDQSSFGQGDILIPERLEAPVYVSIRQDSPTGPPVVGPIDVASNPQTGPRLITEGFGGCYRLVPLERTRTPIENAPELYVTVDASAPGALLLNSIDVNGTGAKVPGTTAADVPGMQSIFDGASFGGWTQSGCSLRDGTAVNARTGNPSQITGCSMTWNSPVHNVVLRLEARRESFFDNGGIWMPGEIQLRGAGEFLTGGFFGEYAARWLKLNAWPDWSEIEIVQLGARYVVSVNGRTVTDHLAAAWAPSPYQLRIAAQPEWSYRWGANAGFGSDGAPAIATPSQWGNFQFRNVRLLQCASATDPVCTALANARPEQAPAR